MGADGGQGDWDSPELAAALREAMLRVSRRARNAASTGDLTMTQMSALTSLESAGPLSPRELAEMERVQPPTLTKIVAKLQERGLIDRDPHPTDGRQQVLQISDAGREVVAQIRRERNEWLALRVAALSPSDRVVLRRATELLREISKDETE